MFYNHWKKIALSLTALFWTGCEDSASSAVCLYGPDPNYSSATENPVSSSSEASQPESSSSFDLEGMALDYGIDIEFNDRYKLASDTSITCEETGEIVFPGNCLLYDSSLRKEAVSDDEIDMEAPLYGVPLYGTPSCVRPEINLKYDCSDGKTRMVHDPVENPLVKEDDGKLLQEGGMLYTWDEYSAKFRNSSSSSETTSSSSGEAGE